MQKRDGAPTTKCGVTRDEESARRKGRHLLPEIRQELFEGTSVPPLHENGRRARRRDPRNDEGRGERAAQAVDYVLWEHRDGPTAEKTEADDTGNGKKAGGKVRKVRTLAYFTNYLYIHFRRALIPLTVC